MFTRLIYLFFDLSFVRGCGRELGKRLLSHEDVIGFYKRSGMRYAGHLLPGAPDDARARRIDLDSLVAWEVAYAALGYRPVPVETWLVYRYNLRIDEARLAQRRHRDEPACMNAHRFREKRNSPPEKANS